MPANFLFGQRMQVSGTNLAVRVERGLPFVGSDKLVVTDNLGSLVREITPFGRGKRIIGVYPFTIGAEGYIVGYADRTGVVQVATHVNPGTSPYNECRIGTEFVEYDLTTGEQMTVK